MNGLKVKLIRSKINRKKTQKLTLQGLGLRKIGDERVYENTPSIRGMVKKVIHLVEVNEVSDKKTSK